MRTRVVVVLAGLSVACSSGSSSNPIGDGSVPPLVIACRSRVDSPFQFAEIALRDDRNLGTDRVADRTGTERHVRLHPDGTRVVFARERSAGDADSREIFTSSIDGSRPEVRLSTNTVLDDDPCWTPDGTRVLFTSTRSGSASLWVMDAETGNATPFVTSVIGTADAEPDSAAATGRVVFSRRDGAGHHALWIANGDGSGAVPLTDGGPAIGADTGDRAPAFAANGAQVVFVRRAGASLATLCVVDVATSAVTVVAQPQGDVATPRFAPAGDRVWFGIAEPSAGRGTLRLATVPLAGGPPTLVWPEERWNLEGFDLAPALPAAAAAATPVQLDVTNANLQIAAGSTFFGAREQLRTADGDSFRVITATIDGREVAGINCRFDLPVPTAEDALELRVRAVANTTRAGADCTLRMSIYNPVDERFDTAVELPVTTTAARTMTFRTSSLRHVTRERQLRVTVIADLAPGAAADLLVDEVAVELVARSGP